VQRIAIIHIFEITGGIIAIIGIIYFGWESPETRTKVTELYLAGFWGLLAFSNISSYRNWNDVHLIGKFLAIAAPVVSILYIVKFFGG
jgi:hypothetical protein